MSCDSRVSFIHVIPYKNRILLTEGSLFKRDLSIPSSCVSNFVSFLDLFRYKLLKLSVFVICFLPICNACVYTIPFVVLYFVSFMKDPELHYGRYCYTFPIILL